ncbi:hypothetical protein GYMLUDRAFT_60497 [Collybiopsis luxurians FD-317 M1]|uniref:Unplaced genomic scaffold GYMLUscaffold_35, whole genome shotgun sequence n=1 Tax=Collybiopsis luxurians FD-317 M1 TaxID=944289 RepID=A0A0D0C888_9AGAR|nr:hypothetical protein GYMLUDRAFT_60497 [Collybiopsis luxurians FD-317 M1]
MHSVLKGIVHYHCHHILCLDALAYQTSAEGIKYAINWPWIPYNYESTPVHLQLESKHIPKIARVQDALCWAIEGDDSLSLDDLWMCLDSKAVFCSLQFIAYTLELYTT